MRPPARACRRRSAGAASRALLWLLALCVATGALPAATLIVNVQTPDGHALPGAVVTVLTLDVPVRHAAPVHAVMDQVNRSFAPDLLVIPVGSTVEFPNSDTVSHQVYSFSPAKRFQLPLYKGATHPPVVFDRAGLVVLGCNIHDGMVGYIDVTDAPYFGKTDGTGTLRLTNLSPGAYQLVLWGPRIADPASSL